MKNGFTVMELLITLIIISIVSTFAFPMIQFLSQKGIADALSMDLLQNIRYARLLAIVRHEPIILCQSKNSKTCGGAWGEGYLIKAKEQPIRAFLNPKNSGVLSWRAFPRGRTFLQFLPNGNLDAENGTFWYCFPKKINPVWAIVISQSGRARIIYPNATDKVILNGTETLQC